MSPLHNYEVPCILKDVLVHLHCANAFHIKGPHCIFNDVLVGWWEGWGKGFPGARIAAARVQDSPLGTKQPKQHKQTKQKPKQTK